MDWAAWLILKGYEKSGLDCYGLDPNNTMVEYGRSLLNLNLVKEDLESLRVVTNLIKSALLR